MPLLQPFAAWVERFYPGLISRLEAIGPGDAERLPAKKGFEVFEPPGRRDQGLIDGVTIGFQYTFESGYAVKIMQRLSLRTGVAPFNYRTDAVRITDWQAYRYSLRLDFKLEGTKFGFELHGLGADELGKGGVVHHVHLDGPIRAQHEPTKDFDPDMTNISPYDFVALVDDYITKGKFPVVRKGS